MTREILPATMCEISQKFIGGPADTMQQCRSKEFSKLRARTACIIARFDGIQENSLRMNFTIW